MKKIAFVAAILLQFALPAISQTNYTNAYKVYNNDNTLRLDFIEHEGDNTIIYISYTGTTSNGTFTGLLLQDFKLVAHTTGEIFRPISSSVPTESDSKFFLHNTGVAIQLTITFKRIPVYVKTFDLVEPTASTVPTYNFTFRNLKFDETKDVTWQLSNWGFDAKSPKYIQVFTNDPMYLDVYIDEVYVGQLTKMISGDAIPNCGKYGTLRIAFADDTIRKIKIVGKTSSKTYTWNMEYRPLMYCQTILVNYSK